MKNTGTKKIILSSTLIFLVLIYVLSFVSVEHNKNKNLFKSALLNTKYEVSSFVLSEKNQSVKIENYIDFWGGTFIKDNECIYFPCDTKTVNDFVKEAQKIIEMEKVLSLEKKNEKKTKEFFRTFGLDKENYINVTFYDSDENEISSVYFGFINKSKDRIFIRTEKSNYIYSIPEKIIDYLNVEIDFWNESEILPESVFPIDFKNQIQNIKYKKQNSLPQNAPMIFTDKFPSFRHSSSLFFSQIQNPENPDLSLEIFDGTGNKCLISFVKTIYDGEECYCTIRKIIPGDLWNPEQKNFIQKINVQNTVSSWTFNSIVELLEQK